jgi:hypothetical protein
LSSQKQPFVGFFQKLFKFSSAASLTLQTAIQAPYPFSAAVMQIPQYNSSPQSSKAPHAKVAVIETNGLINKRPNFPHQ